MPRRNTDGHNVWWASYRVPRLYVNDDLAKERVSNLPPLTQARLNTVAMRLRYGYHGSDDVLGIPTAIYGAPFQGFWVLRTIDGTSNFFEVALAKRAVISRMIFLRLLSVLRALEFSVIPQAAGGFGR